MYSLSKTNNYLLDKGHRKQYSDYSKLIRNSNSTIPSNRLLVIFDYYKTQNDASGDLFTANSYTKDRYTKDVPIISNNIGFHEFYPCELVCQSYSVEEWKWKIEKHLKPKNIQFFINHKTKHILKNT